MSYQTDLLKSIISLEEKIKNSKRKIISYKEDIVSLKLAINTVKEKKKPKFKIGQIVYLIGGNTLIKAKITDITSF